MSAPSEKQAACLRKFGYDASKHDFESASELIDELASNGWKRPDGKEAPKQELDGVGPCTKKQAACLDKFGYESEGVSFDEASSIIDQLAENNWEPIDV